MGVLVAIAHPDRASFNYAIAETAINALDSLGLEVIEHDLYKDGFDPVMPQREIARSDTLAPEIDRYCRDIADAEGFIIVHPNWWGQPPAVMKGWIDRIFRPGVAYEFLEGDEGEGVPLGLLKARAALVFNTGNTPARRELEVFGDPLETLWKTCLFEFCGVNTFYRRMFGVVVTSSEDQRKQWLREVAETVERFFGPGAPSA